MIFDDYSSNLIARISLPIYKVLYNLTVIVQSFILNVLQANLKLWKKYVVLETISAQASRPIIGSI